MNESLIHLATWDYAPRGATAMVEEAMHSIVLTGFPRQAEYLRALLNAHATDVAAAVYGHSRAAMARASVHSLYAYASITIGEQPNGFVRAICETRKRPAIRLWVGSDIAAVAEQPNELEPLRLQKLVHWACAPHLVPELRQLGIEARYVPIASARVPDAAAPMPGAFSVLTYLPEPRRSFYGQRIVWEAARTLPDAHFVVVGPGAPEPGAPPNVTYAGEVDDIDARLDASSVLFRVPEHDGLSVMVIEALARARHVIWTYPFPGVRAAASPSEAIAALISLRDAHLSGELRLNETGSLHVARYYAPKPIAQGIARALGDESVRLNSPGRAESKLRLAVSGQSVLSARVAENFGNYSSDITSTVLTTPTMSDTFVSASQLARSHAWYTICEPVAPRVLELAASLFRTRRVVHWLGDDVNLLASNAALLRKFRSRSILHLANDAAVASRLNDLGLRASVVPLPVVAPVTDIPPLPKEFTLSLYLPESESARNARLEYERLMRSLLHQPVHYIVIGGGAIDVPPGAPVERTSKRRALHEVYDRSSALIALTPDVCASTMVIEALMRGRYVICTGEVPFAASVSDYAGLEQHVLTLLQRHLDGTLAADAEAAAATNRAYAPEHCFRLVAEACARK